MKIAISGSSGFIGSALRTSLSRESHEVISLNRDDFKSGLEPLLQKLNGCDIIINLAGYPITKRWTKKNRELIMESRVLTTRMIVNAISAMEKKPSLFISTSAVGIYLTGKECSESGMDYDNDFMARVCLNWEEEALQARTMTRLVIFRIGVVLGRQGGALNVLLPFFRAGLGGRIGNGENMMSWIHLDDCIHAFNSVIRDDSFKGIYNLCSPNAVTNAVFTKALSSVLRRPALLVIPVFALMIWFGNGIKALIASKHAVPQRLSEQGFVFIFSDIRAALDDILKKR